MSVAQFEPLKPFMEWKFMGKKAKLSEMGRPMPWNIHLHSLSGQMLVHVSLKESEARNINC